jgi:peptidyl-prolyl cis-trans isomerase SDCCAG10
MPFQFTLEPNSLLRQTEIEKIEADIRKLARKRDGNDSDEAPTKKPKHKSYLEEETAKYAKNRGLHKKSKDGRKKDETDVLAALSSFRNKLHKSVSALDEGDDPLDDGGAEKPAGQEDLGIEVDDDRGFLNHALHFPMDDGEESRKAERDYEVIDPRQRGARAKEEERERKRNLKAKGGGRHYRH